MLSSQLLYRDLSDLELFSLIKEDNIKAFEELYNRHWAGLVDAAYRRLQSSQRAEDLVQDLFVSLYQKRTSIEFTVSLQAYLNQALKYKILNEFRSDNTRNTYQKAVFFSPVCKNDFASALEAKELHRKIDMILESLPEKCRKVFLLSRRENRSNKEISQSLSISLSTVEKHIGRALKTLRNALPEYHIS